MHFFFLWITCLKVTTVFTNVLHCFLFTFFHSSSINTNLAYLCCFLDLFHYYLPPFGAKLFCLFSLPLLFIIISLTFLSRECLTRFLFIFIFFHTLHCLCLIKIECVYACVVFVFWSVCFWHFTCFLWRNGIWVACCDVVIILVAVSIILHI